MITSIGRIREALDHIPVGGHDDRVRIACAIRNGLGDAGFELWDACYRKRGDAYDPAESKSVWRSVNGNGGVTIGTLFHEAKARGWVYGSLSAPSPDEAAERKRLAEERTRKNVAEIEGERAKAAELAAAIWKTATEAQSDDPYLQRKRVAPTGTLREIDADKLPKLLGYTPESSGKPLEGRVLVVPVVRATRGAIWGLSEWERDYG